MQRWGIPWEHTELEWTMSQYVCLLAAVLEDAAGTNAKRGMNPVEYAHRMSGVIGDADL